MASGLSRGKNFTRRELNKILVTIQQEHEWQSKHKFQKSIIENAFHRLSKRIIGWMMHTKQWKDDDETGFEQAFAKLEKKHFSAYQRWLKVTKAKGGFQLNTNKGDDLETRIRRMFVYYLVYGEIHDFRNLKSVFHLFYHVALHIVEKESLTDANLTLPPQSAGEWLREQGKKLYKIFGVVYNKDEMNRTCFHHDDLDDVCNTNNFVKKFLKKSDMDFEKAFDLGGEKKPFAAIEKVIELDMSIFIKYWQKSVQGSLSPQERQEREKWILSNAKVFLNKKSSEELSMIDAELPSLLSQLARSEKEMEAHSSRKDEYAERSRPSEKDFATPDERTLFKKSFTQLETAKELLVSAGKTEEVGIKSLEEAKVKHFRDKATSSKAYDLSLGKLHEANMDYVECTAGLQNAIDGFKSLQNCTSYILEANIHLAKSRYKQLDTAVKKLTAKKSRLLQHGFEDSVNADRAKFAKKWKTFFENAGGCCGYKGYLTIFKHYSSVVYLHFFLFFPLAWFYSDYHEKISLNDIGGGFSSLVSMDTIMEPEENIILMAALTVVMIITSCLCCWCLQFRTRGGTSAPRRDKGTKTRMGMKERCHSIFIWILVLITEIALMKFLVINPIKDATEKFVDEFMNNPAKNIILLIIHWFPVVVLFLSSTQYVFNFWIGIFGYVYGIRDGLNKIITWPQVVAVFHIEGKLKGETPLPPVVEMFHKTMMPESDSTFKDLVEEKKRKVVAFARVWNEIIQYFYDIHKISKEELQRFSYQIRNTDTRDFLAGDIEQIPDLKNEPRNKDVRYHLIRFVNNIMNKKKPNNVSVREMLPLTVCTPVGNEKIIYPYEYITHVDNTQSSFLHHLIHKLPDEWENFKKREATSTKAQDFIDRLEKDILQGLQPDQTKKRWIHNHKEGIALKLKICEWGSMRFQALYRTIYGFMQIPVALQVLARVQEPTLTQAEAEDLVKKKFSYVVGYQSFGRYYQTYKSSKDKISLGLDLSPEEMEAHDAVYNIKYIKEKFPAIRIAYPDFENGKYIGRLGSGVDPTTGNYFDYEIELFGPFADMGLGKPTNQNFLSSFIDGLVVQTIDVNQDNVISQSF